VAPSYEAFVALSRGRVIDWNAGHHGNWPRMAEVIKAARELAGKDISIVSIDMPVAAVLFSARRAADSAISKTFGGQACSTHSPNASRPGNLGASLISQLLSEGFPLATSYEPNGLGARTIETYPHPALLSLLSANYRIPYKVSKSGKYWKGAPVHQRISNLLIEFQRIYSALKVVLGPLPLELPSIDEVRTLSHLKKFEDALDALICAWVGLRFLEGTAKAFGDSTAAIWVPTDE